MGTIHTVSRQFLHSFICVDSHPPVKLLHQTLAVLLALVDAGFHIIGNLELNNSGCDRDHIRYQTQIQPQHNSSYLPDA
jgi:hypothetical protein